MSELHKNLKSLRRERKIELQAIEKRTKIDLKYLKAIESGNFEVLPSTYIRLFLKAYCVEIGADPLDALPIAEKLNAKAINPSYKSLNPKNVKKIHKAGYKVYPYTVNSKEKISKLISLNVDGIITDYPERVIEIIKNP